MAGRAVDRLRVLVARGPLVKNSQREKYLENSSTLAASAMAEAEQIEDADERQVAMAEAYTLLRAATEGWPASRAPIAAKYSRSDKVRAIAVYDHINKENRP